MAVSVHKSIIQQFSFEGKSIRSVYVENSGTCLVAGDVWEAIGYNKENGKKAIQRHVPKIYRLRFGDLLTKNDHLHHNTVLLKQAGLRLFLTRCGKPKAVEFARLLGINIENSLCMSKEQDTLSCIMKAFDGEEMKCQFTVDKYRIDLYFPKHKIAVECDEFDHCDRDISYEIKRQKCIENLLGCQFIRFNPDAEDFCIFKVINQIHWQI